MAEGGDEPVKVEMSTNMGVPGGAGILRPTCLLEDALSAQERAKFEALLGGSGFERPARAQGSAPSVLTCEDDPRMRATIAPILGGMGCEAYEVGNGADALKALAAQPIDLLILDLRLPALDGFGVLRGLRSFLGWSMPPVLVLTALGSVEDETAVFNLGANGMVRKPFRLPQLKAHVRNLLRLGGLSLPPNKA